jgi:hypothetical protein
MTVSHPFIHDCSDLIPWAIATNLYSTSISVDSPHLSKNILKSTERRSSWTDWNVGVKHLNSNTTYKTMRINGYCLIFGLLCWLKG